MSEAANHSDIPWKSEGITWTEEELSIAILQELHDSRARSSQFGLRPSVLGDTLMVKNTQLLDSCLATLTTLGCVENLKNSDRFYLKLETDRFVITDEGEHFLEHADAAKLWT
ncbi:MAG: hypothetical protein SGJ27_10185 [Candidatus Melainabacteria bacterium]|nr:hypothetical protein [Candidatus Melainabacteria bacterium]